MEANNAKFIKGMDELGRKVQKFERVQKEAIKKTENGWKKFSSDFRKVVGLFGFAAMAKQVVSFTRSIAQASDSVFLLSKRLETFSGSSGVFASSFEAAQKLGVAVEDVAGGMARFLVVGREIGVTAYEAERLTVTFQQLAKLGGATGAESSAAFIQLTQGLGAGVLRGQELNSILEQAPLVAQAIAKELNVSVGALKKMGEEGKITADVIRGALANAATEANEKFAALPDTLAQQQARLENAWKMALAGLDESLKASEVWQFFNKTLTTALENFARDTVSSEFLSGNQLDARIRVLEQRAAQIRSLIGAAESQRGQFGGAPGVGENFNRAALVAIEAELNTLRIEGTKRNFEELDAVNKIVAAETERVELSKELLARPQGTNVGLSSIYVPGNEEAILQAMAKIESKALDVRETFVKFPDEVSPYWDAMAQNMQNSMAQFFLSIDKGIDGMVKGFAQAMLDIAANIAASKFLQFIGGALSGYGGIFGSIGKALSGARAAGGPVTQGQSYLVGERGPEIFTPRGAGRITNDMEGGGAMAVTYSPNFRINDDTDLKRALPTILAADKREFARVLSQAMSRSGMPVPVF